MKKDKSTVKNGSAVFRRPLYINRCTIYGIVYNKEKESEEKKLHLYMSYLLGMEQFLHNGGQTYESKRKWRVPEGYTVECNSGLQALIHALLKNYTKFGIIEFQDPLEYTPDEIDDGFIVGKSFMERYVFSNPDKIIEQ